MKRLIYCLLSGLLVVVGAGVANAQVGGHYPAGVEGIKAGSLPPPGLYFRDYNLFYTADRIRNGLPMGDTFEVNVYAQVPRIIYLTDWKILGANYGFDVLATFIYTDLKAPGYKNSAFGLGDIFVEPILLSWNFDRFDLGFGYGFWAPTGEFDLTRPDKPGSGFWTHMLTLGGTYYLDSEKTLAISALNRYEFHHEQRFTHIEPGQTWTLEWGISKSIRKTIDIGVIGYYQHQVTRDDVSAADLAVYRTMHPAYSPDIHDSVIGIGPEISAVCPKLGLITSLRYQYEFGANDRPEGHRVVLTVTKRF
ncbi:MAG: SphA family protein [Verrucomicrobiia bacterium]|jgi:hypothetical protein